MPEIPEDERLLTEIDFARLNKLSGTPFPPELVDTLEALDLVPSREIPPDVVTMYSQVIVEDLGSGQQRRLTLCYPRDSAPDRGLVSVLSPVGASLLGQRVGSIARWRMPGGDDGAARILALLYQPEASGDITT